MSMRENRRLEEKRTMIPFGDIMLPVIGLVAVGLLIVGVKLFFLSGPKTPGYSPMSPSAPSRQETQGAVPANTRETPPPGAPSKTPDNRPEHKLVRLQDSNFAHKLLFRLETYRLVSINTVKYTDNYCQLALYLSVIKG